VICSVSTGGGPLGNTACGQTFIANDFLNWGAPTSSGGLGEAIEPDAFNLGQSVQVSSSSGIEIDVSTGATLDRADNTEYAWDASIDKWVTQPFVTFGQTINTFAGQFNAPSYQSSNAPYGPNGYPYPYGDPLLGAVGSTGGTTQMDFSFSQSLSGIAFDVSSATNSDFVATLAAYTSSGALLGIYEVNTNGAGGGGTCLGLDNPATGTNPQPCNDAPVIQFYDPEGRIASVVLTVNDNGLYVDQLSLDTIVSPTNPIIDPTGGAPEPGPECLTGGGLIALALVTRRLSRVRQKKHLGSDRGADL
jgi:hypothetical protein